MNRKRNGHLKYGLAFAALLALLLLFLGWSLCAGSVEIPLEEVAEVFAWKLGCAPAPGASSAAGIVWEIRFPRALAAILLGGALGLSGYLLQTFFRNPIAGPFVLGISSGAKLLVACLMVFSLGHAVRVTSAAMILAAFAGALASMGLVLLMAGRVEQTAGLILGGTMIGYICSAATDILVTFADDTDIVNLHNWSMGSFSGTTWDQVRVMTAVVIPVFVLSFCMAKPISAYQLGEEYARSLGVNVKRFRAELILLSSILSACVTAFAGPVSFVGIAVPQLVKRLFGTAKPIVVIPGCFLGGAVFCLFSDLIARTMFAPTELSISSVTAVFGAPVVIWMMIRRKGAQR